MGGIDLKHLKIKMKSMTSKVKCPFITKSEPIRAQYSFFQLANNLKTFVIIINFNPYTKQKNIVHNLAFRPCNWRNVKSNIEGLVMSLIKIFVCVYIECSIPGRSFRIFENRS